jgi:hypothetical protein
MVSVYVLACSVTIYGKTTVHSQDSSTGIGDCGEITKDSVHHQERLRDFSG